MEINESATHSITNGKSVVNGGGQIAEKVVELSRDRSKTDSITVVKRGGCRCRFGVIEF